MHRTHGCGRRPPIRPGLSRDKKRLLRLSTLVFVVGTAVNYPWEVLQAPLYSGMESWRFVMWHCFRAAIGDGLLVLLIFAAAAATQRSLGWFRTPRAPAIVAVLVAGLALGVLVEWWGLNWARRWTYSDLMPLVPGLGIGAVPILQILVLPPVVFWILSRHKMGGLDA